MTAIAAFRCIIPIINMNGAPLKTYTLSAGVVIMRSTQSQPRYLMLRAFNYWDFPKGVVEPGEDPQQAAMREVREETGLILSLEDFRWAKATRKPRLMVWVKSLVIIWPNPARANLTCPSTPCSATRT